METKEISIKDCLTEAIELYKNNFFLVIITSAIAIVGSALTIGVLAGPLIAGLFLVLLKLYDQQLSGVDGPKPEVGEVFQAFDKFKDTFLFFLGFILVNIIVDGICSIIPGIGGYLSFAISLALATAVMFAIPLIAENGSAAIDAVKESIEKTKPNFLQLAVLVLIGQLIASIGVFIFGVGVFITAPFYILITTIAYRKYCNTTPALASKSSEAVVSSEAEEDKGRMRKVN
jgi:uncharacterized membrane protein